MTPYIVTKNNNNTIRIIKLYSRLQKIHTKVKILNSIKHVRRNININFIPFFMSAIPTFFLSFNRPDLTLEKEKL